MKLTDVYAAQERIRRFINMTPLIASSNLQRECNKSVWLKLETQNPTGSFKPRPAFNGMLMNLEAAKQKGVIASSSGNFAQGVAYAAAQLGVDALIVMPEDTSPYKIERTKKLGATVALSANSHEARTQLTNELQQKTGRVLLHPYDSLETIAGDATIGLELSIQLAEVLNQDTVVLVPVSGGGLIAGIAFVLKHLHPNCKIIGVQSNVSATLEKSLVAGQPVNVGKYKTIADALVASKLGDVPFEIISQYVDGAISVEEKQIASATRYMLEQHKLVVEPASAISIAALFAYEMQQQNVVCLITGGNIDLKNYNHVVGSD